MKKILFILLCLLFITPEAEASYQDYNYTSSKSHGNIAYELLKIDLTEKGLKLEGWAYINNAQHYQNKNDLEITIRAYGYNGNHAYDNYYRATTTNIYNLTSTNYYEGSPYCQEGQYLKPAWECNYYYNVVSFNLLIPLSEFKYGYTYEFYLYVNAKKANIKKYTKLYSPNVEKTLNLNGYIYEFSSSIEEVAFKANTDRVFVRQGPSKSSPKYQYNGYNYYYKPNLTYYSKNKEYTAPVTWYQLDLKRTEEMSNRQKYVNPGNQIRGYIPSIYVDYLGSGNSKLTIKHPVDVNLESVTMPTFQNNENLDVYIKTTSHKTIETNVLIYINNNLYYYENHPTNENIKITINQDAFANKNNEIKIIVQETFDYNDPNNQNDVIVTNFDDPTEEVIDINLTNQNTINYEGVVGKKVSQQKTTKYYEQIIISTLGSIQNIEKNWGNTNYQFNNFYAGGYFEYPLTFSYTHNYPYSIKNDNISAELKIDHDYLDPFYKDQSSINFQCENQQNKIDCQLPKSYMNHDGQLFQEGSKNTYEVNALYTNLKLKTGKYPFQVIIRDVGINQDQLNLNTYFTIFGDILGNDQNDLFYYRPVNQTNPFTNKTTYWSQYQFNEVADNDSLQTIKINVTPEAKAILNTVDGSDFKTLKKTVDQLIEEGVIIIQ